ncbi:MAG: Zn-dependent oligopeptidase [Candidatus Eisenbacteria bacterium]|uniref:Zn-dependent oligopeptidase n=1 Tax=Eiseniibacteriota bacterium TaxID=2212470 RepID=A0A538TZU5_UNCEI|nr:MAG: Zn-dependent oligopeptidase [Candidatus Eisenbacteria bacterium]
MEAARQAIARMEAVKGKRTAHNTLTLYDEAQRQLDMVGAQAGLIENVSPDSATREAAEKLSQDVSAYGTELSLDPRAYQALRALDLSRQDAETRYYVQHELRDFTLAGVNKDDATRTKIKALREDLVKIGQDFDRHIRDDVRSVQAKPAELEGVPPDWLESHKPGADGAVKVTINYPDYIPVMTYAKNDDLRHRLYMEYNNRGYPKNVETLHQMLEKRNELAKTLGYSSWAEYITADKMAGDPKTVRTFIDRIVAISGARADREYQTLLKRKRQDDPTAQVVQPWESARYTDLIGKSEYNFDSQKARPYFEYDEVKQGVLDISSRMFGVQFRRVADAPVWDPSVECWEMMEGGKRVGRFYLDMHPRPNKYNHAAQFDVRTGIEGRQIPEAALVCNLPGGTPGERALMDHDDMQTMLHEFGHLLHSLFAGHHRWVGVGGIRTEHDFVEAPSQMLEEWAWDPKVLQTFAKNEKGEPIPTEMVTQMKRPKDYGEGLRTRRQMVYADLSLSIHDRDPQALDPDAVMADLVKKYQPFPFVPGTHFSCSFGHLDGYSAVYYTYMWSLVIAKDMFSHFDKSNLLDPTMAIRYRKTVLEPGGSKPAAELVKDFLGRPFNSNAFEKWLNQDETKTSMN